MFVPGNSPFCDVHTVLHVCVGADRKLGNPLEKAQRKLTVESDPKAKQRYGKVHKDTHTITHFGITNNC